MNTDKIFAKSVVNEYSIKTSRKVVALRKLDKWVKRPAKIAALILGITSSFLNIIGVALLADLPVPIAISCKFLGLTVYSVGLIGMAVSPLVYKQVLECRKRENAFDVVELAREIIQSEGECAF